MQMLAFLALLTLVVELDVKIDGCKQLRYTVCLSMLQFVNAVCQGRSDG